MRGAPLRRDLRFTPTGMDFEDSFCLRFQFPDEIENTKSPARLA